MLSIILAYVGGLLTILSPCILPVLPLVFARADKPFVRSGLPLLAGMAITFVVVSSVAVAGGVWVVQANQYGRWMALLLFGVFGIALLFPVLSDRLMRPFVNAGSRLTRLVGESKANPGVLSSVILGIATGLLWAPCAGPILGLVLTGAVLHGADRGTTLLLLAYAAGASTSLALALTVGARILAVVKRSFSTGERIRRGMGGAILFVVVAISLGLDTRALAHVPTLATSGIEETLVQRLSPGTASATRAAAIRDASAGSVASKDVTATLVADNSANAVDVSPWQSLPVESVMPSLTGAVQWLNSPPLKTDDLRGKVVIVNFWTYSCINCLRTLPYLRAWSKRYHDQGLVVIGVHAPEFAFEHDVGNVRRANSDLGIEYPVAIDNNYAIWKAFGNQYWPAFYVVDAQGNIRYHHFGEGEYDQSEQVIRQLLAEAGHSRLPSVTGGAKANGTQVAADNDDLLSTETYVGYQQAQGFASREAVLPGEVRAYTSPGKVLLNTWSLEGQWKVDAERAQLANASGKIAYRFHARDLHLVLGPAADGKPVRFRVTIDGAPPGASHGTDVAPDGSGSVDRQRLYQLVRQVGPVRDRTFTIEFLDPGVNAYAFTFG
jgi:cytochrome c biogenesis protein CcdA/thiol-disulfide isomerase/thioredoxin